MENGDRSGGGHKQKIGRRNNGAICNFHFIPLENEDSRYLVRDVDVTSVEGCASEPRDHKKQEEDEVKSLLGKLESSRV
jgi:hypothetical protein